MATTRRRLTSVFASGTTLFAAALLLLAAPAEAQDIDSTALRFDTLALTVAGSCHIPQCGVNSLSLRSFVIRRMAERDIVTHRRRTPDELGLALAISFSSSDLGGQLTYAATATLRSAKHLWRHSEQGFVTARRVQQDSEAIAARLVDAFFATYGIPRRN